MLNFTGYEPKTAGPSGQGSGLQPTSSASAAADAAMVPLPQDTLAEDLNNINMTSLEDFLDVSQMDEAMVAAPPRQDTLVSQNLTQISTMPFVVLTESQSPVAGGNSHASSDTPLVPRALAKRALDYQTKTFEAKTQ